MTARVGVITFPGSLDDADAARAVARAGAEPVPLWHGDRDLRGLAAVILPGGFSYGDYLRCGAIARFAPVMSELISAARAGLPVLGICNGFQILCEAHLLPGALTRNAGLRFIDRVVRVRIEDTQTPWTSDYAQDQEVELVLKSGEGAYVADPATLARLTSAGQVVARYAGGNPNGSVGDIAGVRSEGGNVVGLMPHPEHAIDALTGPGPDGLGFFTSVLRADGRASERHHGHREPGHDHARPAPAVRRTRPDQCGVRADRRAAGPPGRPTRSWPSTRSCGASTAPTSRPRSTCAGSRSCAASAPLLAGIGQNAGVVDIGQGYAVTFKVESHNHPSYVEPFQGGGDRRGGDRARHPGHGGPPGGGDGLAAVRARGGARYPPGAARGGRPASRSTAICRACPTSAVNSPSTPTAAYLVNAPRAGVDNAAPGPQAGRGPRDREPGGPVRLPDRPGRHRRRFGAGQCHVRRSWWGGRRGGWPGQRGGWPIPRSGPASRSATRSWRNC